MLCTTAVGEGSAGCALCRVRGHQSPTSTVYHEFKSLPPPLVYVGTCFEVRAGAAAARRKVSGALQCSKVS